MPWLLTPAAPDRATDRLRPWCVLVVVAEQDGVTVAPGPVPVGLHDPGALKDSVVEDVKSVVSLCSHTTVRRAVQAVDAGGCIVEQLGLLVRRVAGGQALERIPQYGVAAALLIHGEI